RVPARSPGHEIEGIRIVTGGNARAARMTAMPLTDAYGLRVTAASRDAVDAYDRGADALLGFGADACDRLRGAIAREPDFAIARAAGRRPLPRRAVRRGPRGDAVRGRGGARALRARAAPRRGAFAVGRGPRLRRDRRHARDPRRSPARRRGAAAPVLHLLLAGALGRHARPHSIGARRVRARLLHAGAAR